MTEAEVLDKIGIKIPNNYIDRMFGSEPFLIDDILHKVMKHVHKFPGVTEGSRGPNELSSISMNKSRNTNNRKGSSVRASLPLLRNNKLTSSNNQIKETEMKPVYQQPLYPAQDIGNSNQKAYKQTDAKVSQHIMASPAKRGNAFSALPKVKQVKEKKSHKQMQEELKVKMLKKDIITRDEVIEKLEDAIRAAQRQVAELEKLVQIKNKKIFLFQHRHDPVFISPV